MGFLDASALPDSLDEASEIENAFPDDSENGAIIRWIKKKTKVWAAFGPRSPVGVAIMVAPWPLLLWLLGWPVYHWPWTWWALWPFLPVLRKWRKKPFVILAICGQGSWRLERLSGGEASAPRQRLFWTGLEGEYYLSRVQPWTRWHFAILWPLSIQGRFFPKKEDVVPAGWNGNTDGKSWFSYIITHFDGDWVYWCPSAYLGKNSK